MHHTGDAAIIRAEILKAIALSAVFDK